MMASPTASSPRSSPSKRRARSCEQDDDEFEDLGEVFPTERAKIHGFVQSLSLIKNNIAGTRKYFTGQITDGKVSRRLVGFDARVHQGLSD